MLGIGKDKSIIHLMNERIREYNELIEHKNLGNKIQNDIMMSKKKRS